MLRGGAKLLRPKKHYFGRKKAHKHKSADCKRGRRKLATSKTVTLRQKVSKSFSTLFDYFRAGQKTSKIAKRRQKVCRHLPTVSARHHCFWPLTGVSVIKCEQRINVELALGQTAGCPRVIPGQKVYVFASKKHRII